MTYPTCDYWKRPEDWWLRHLKPRPDPCGLCVDCKEHIAKMGPLPTRRRGED